jgi:hypothetical protein
MTAPNADDERIRAAFDDLKRADGRARGTYAGVSARRAPARATLLASPVLRLAAAGVVLAAAIVTYRIGVAREPRLTVPTEVVALVAWRPETDVLLAAPVQLLRAQTKVRESMIDLDTLTTGVLR